MIHYVSYFLNHEEIKGRKLEVAAQSKIRYIIDSIKIAGYDISVVSTTCTTQNCKFSPEKKLIVDKQETHIYLSALGSMNVFIRKLRRIYMQIQLLVYLIKEVKDNDVVLAYHALSYVSIMKMCKIIKKNRFILEINDLYALHFKDLKVMNRIKKKECTFFDCADGYLLASPYMAELLRKNKPAVISYGSYKSEQCSQKRKSDKIHVVYTGVVENLRNAATLVVNSVLFLSDEYVIHIAGYGTEENINKFVNLCREINEKKGFKAVIYHGLLLGKEFDELLNGCEISLNAHVYSEENLWKSRFSFPSKIPLNMSYDLYLVSHDMEVISQSPFAEFTTFFKKFEPKAVADAIVRCSSEIKNRDKERTPRELIMELDENFVKEIKEIFHV